MGSSRYSQKRSQERNITGRCVTAAILVWYIYSALDFSYSAFCALVIARRGETTPSGLSHQQYIHNHVSSLNQWLLVHVWLILNRVSVIGNDFGHVRFFVLNDWPLWYVAVISNMICKLWGLLFELGSIPHSRQHKAMSGPAVRDWWQMRWVLVIACRLIQSMSSSKVTLPPSQPPTHQPPTPTPPTHQPPTPTPPTHQPPTPTPTHPPTNLHPNPPTSHQPPPPPTHQPPTPTPTHPPATNLHPNPSTSHQPPPPPTHQPPTPQPHTPPTHQPPLPPPPTNHQPPPQQHTKPTDGSYCFTEYARTWARLPTKPWQRECTAMTDRQSIDSL